MVRDRDPKTPKPISPPAASAPKDRARPPGAGSIVVRRVATGAGALARLLVELKRFHFTGAVEVRTGPSVTGSAPARLMEINGVPVAARHANEGGAAAIAYFLKSAREPGGELVVLGRIDVGGTLRDEPGSRLRGDLELEQVRWTGAEIEHAIERGSVPLRAARKAVPVASSTSSASTESKDAAAQESRLMRMVVEGWKGAGYDVADLLRGLETGSPRAREMFGLHEANIRRLRDMDSRLVTLESGGLAPEAAMLRSQLKDPSRVEAMETEVARLVTKAAEGRKLDRLRRIEESGSLLAAEYRRRSRQARVREIFGLVLRAPLKGGPPPGRRPGRIPENLQTFDTFMVSPRNREAYDGALAVARRSRKHTMVLIVGPKSTGKSHLLRAVEAQLLTAGKIKVGRVDCADPLESLPPREADIGLKALRRARSADQLLLIDHLDHVAARDDLGVEVSRMIEDAVARGAQVLAACQQSRIALPPLVGAGGDLLSTAIALETIPLGFDDRVGLLQRRASTLGYDIPKSVVAFIARAHSADPGVELTSLEKMLVFAVLLRQAPDMAFTRSSIADSMMI